MNRKRVLNLIFSVKNFRQVIELKGRDADIKGTDACIFQTPESQDEIFVGDTVRRILRGDGRAPFRLDDDALVAKLFEAIDADGSESPVVLVKRVGVGATDLSAKFTAQVNQKRCVDFQGEIVESKLLQFVLPVSQIQTIGASEYAPLWLILEKVKSKQQSDRGRKSREKNRIESEYVPTQARAVGSKRTEALKAWIVAKRDELSRIVDAKEKEEVLQLYAAADAVKAHIARFIDESSRKPVTALSINVFRSKLERSLEQDFQLLPGHLLRPIAERAAIELREMFLHSLSSGPVTS